MLHLMNPEIVEGKEIMHLVREFRRVQVSRFPINVKFIDTEAGFAKFYDSRFEANSVPAVALLWKESDGKEKDYWVLESRLIHNDRYRGDRRTQKRTKDLKKMLRYMRDFVKPLSAKEIAVNTRDVLSSRIGRWKHEAIEKMRNTCDFDRDAVMEELVRMRAVGYKPQTAVMARIMEQGIDAWEEAKRRSERKVMQVHVFMNPDESVEVFCDDNLGYGGINHGVTVFNSLTEAPVNIQQSIAMLRMLEDKTHVPEVGVKVDERNYWVEVFPE